MTLSAKSVLTSRGYHSLFQNQANPDDHNAQNSSNTHDNQESVSNVTHNQTINTPHTDETPAVNSKEAKMSHPPGIRQNMYHLTK